LSNRGFTRRSGSGQNLDPAHLGILDFAREGNQKLSVGDVHVDRARAGFAAAPGQAAQAKLSWRRFLRNRRTTPASNPAENHGHGQTYYGESQAPSPDPTKTNLTIAHQVSERAQPKEISIRRTVMFREIGGRKKRKDKTRKGRC
jgi:hypothetical protein